MCHIVKLGVITILVAVAAIAHASTTTGDRQAYDIQYLVKALSLYFADNGHYPTSDSTATWFQKLAAADYVRLSHLSFGTTSDGTLPIDLYERPLVYEVSDAMAADTVVIRSVGRDGIDNQGAGDDFDSRYGANLGHWNKRNWPTYFAFTTIGFLFAVVVGFLVWFRSHRFLTAARVFLLAEGTLIGWLFSFPFGCGFWRTTASRMPEWSHTLANYSILASLLGLALGVGEYASRTLKKRRTGPGLCSQCGYDLRGQSPDRVVCPECGYAAPVSGG